MKNRSIKTALFALSALLCLSSTITHARVQEGEISIPFETVSRNRYSGITQLKNAIVTNTMDWQRLWKKINDSTDAIPEIDFSQRTVIAVFNGIQGDANNQIEITRIVKVGKNYEVFARENHTHPTCPPPPPVWSSSYYIVVVDKIKKAEKRVNFMPHEHQSIPCL